MATTCKDASSHNSFNTLIVFSTNNLNLFHQEYQKSDSISLADRN
jgi:hypothetical protein